MLKIFWPRCLTICFFFLLVSANRGNSDVTGAMSLGEFIELRDLRSERDPIGVTRAPFSPPRLERANALRISPGKVPDLLSRVGIIRVLSSTQDPQFTEERGEGHNFQPCSHAQPTWCDLCGDFIWGLYKQSLRCTSESTRLIAWLCFCGLLRARTSRRMTLWIGGADAHCSWKLNLLADFLTLLLFADMLWLGQFHFSTRGDHWSIFRL